ncbi:MAG: hypothetical protein H6855_00870 [Rhodospirillales bacterium]|nr:hypothetical protein [Rhodospirillales bacterium]MCB9964621.1 hypothetical protein [Rhodospirillales bacterium]MCB9979911.1 hypothetical protein [Rhodospirillales bacterium]
MIPDIFLSQEIHESIRNSTGFSTLAAAVKAGELEIRGLFAAHGSGSTATARTLAQTGNFDLFVNEPDCTSFTGKHTNSIIDAYHYLAQQYLNLKETRQEESGPCRLLVKLMPSNWLTLDSYDDLVALMKGDPLYVGRYPAFSVEARLRQMARLQVKNMHSNPSTVSQEEEKILSQGLAARDYSRFPKQLMFAHTDAHDHHPARLRQISAYAPSLPEILGFPGTGSAQFKIDFSEFTRIYDLMSYWHSEHKVNPTSFLDFEAYQQDPEGIGSYIVNKMWKLDPKENRPPPKIVNAYLDFYPQERAQGFVDITFGATLSLDDPLLPPTSRPLRLSKFPEFLRAPLADMTFPFVQACRLSKIGYSSLQEMPLKELKELDPVYLLNAAHYHVERGVPVPLSVAWLIAVNRLPFRESAQHISFCCDGYHQKPDSIPTARRNLNVDSQKEMTRDSFASPSLP